MHFEQRSKNSQVFCSVSEDARANSSSDHDPSMAVHDFSGSAQGESATRRAPDARVNRSQKVAKNLYQKMRKTSPKKRSKSVTQICKGVKRCRKCQNQFPGNFIFPSSRQFLGHVAHRFSGRSASTFWNASGRPNRISDLPIPERTKTSIEKSAKSWWPLTS